MIRHRLTDLIDAVLNEMESSGFAEGTRRLYLKLFNRLKRLAEERGDEYYTEELGQAFIQDDSHIIPQNSVRYYHERTLAYIRCIRYMESYLRDGKVDWTPALHSAEFPLKPEQLMESFVSYQQELEKRRLKPNTIDGYRRFTYYFIEYLESKGYTSLKDIKPGDVVAFIAVICSERYLPTSLGSHMPGLKIFLSLFDTTETFLQEIPEHLPKKRDILQVYSDEEYTKIVEHLELSTDISFRNKAITIMALETGMRAVDICGLKLTDIDWKHDCIHIIQSKTSRVQNIPLSETMGNALVNYLLNERPVSDSEFVFLRNRAPYVPLMSHAGIRGILFQVVNDSDIEAKGRVYGSRITRHSAASRMLRNGVPLTVISEALGHGNPNSVMIYITTDDAKLAACTLPLPKGGIQNG